MKFDLHCHTSHGSIDGKISIEEYIKQLIQNGFHGMMVTDHNSYKGYRAFQDLCMKTHLYNEFVVLKGVEYDTLDAGHFLVVMPDKVRLPILEIRGMPLSLLIKIVHTFGGILGPAHPYGAEFLSCMHSKKLKKHPDLVYEFDFIEVYNTCNTQEANMKARDLAKRLKKPSISGSDAHKIKYIGTAYTDFDYEVRSNNDFINAIRLKKVAACGGSGYDYREPLLSRILPLRLVWTIYNRGLGLIKAHARKVNLKNLNQLWEKVTQ